MELGSLHQNISGEQLRSSNLHRGFFCPGDWDAQISTESTSCLEFLSLSLAAPQPVNHLSETVLISPSWHTVCHYCGLPEQHLELHSVLLADSC